MTLKEEESFKISAWSESWIWPNEGTNSRERKNSLYQKGSLLSR